VTGRLGHPTLRPIFNTIRERLSVSTLVDGRLFTDFEGTAPTQR